LEVRHRHERERERERERGPKKKPKKTGDSAKTGKTTKHKNGTNKRGRLISIF
jgi:hypothetical protein